MVEGARLESVCRGNSTEGSNPSLSANLSQTPASLAASVGRPHMRARAKVGMSQSLNEFGWQATEDGQSQPLTPGRQFALGSGLPERTSKKIIRSPAHPATDDRRFRPRVETT